MRLVQLEKNINIKKKLSRLFIIIAIEVSLEKWQCNEDTDVNSSKIYEYFV